MTLTPLIGSGSGDVNLFSPQDITLSNNMSRELSGRGFQSALFGSILGTPSRQTYFYRSGSLPDDPDWNDIKDKMQEIK